MDKNDDGPHGLQWRFPAFLLGGLTAPASKPDAYPIRKGAMGFRMFGRRTGPMTVTKILISLAWSFAVLVTTLVAPQQTLAAADECGPANPLACRSLPSSTELHDNGPSMPMSQAAAATGYCPSYGGSTLYESLSNVDVIQQAGGTVLITVHIDIANPTGCTSGSPCPEYDNSPEYINAWIDWNGNQVFEASERVIDVALTGYLGINYQGTMTTAVSVTVPPTAVQSTSMRVNLGWGYDPNDPCEQSWTWGNVYDRQVQIHKTRVMKLDALHDVDIRDQNGNAITDPIWEEDIDGNIIDNDPIAARYTGAAFDIKAYLGPLDPSWEPMTSVNWKIVGTPFGYENITFFGWEGTIPIILPQQVGVYDLNMVFTIYDENHNVVKSAQTITRKLYVIYDTPKTTSAPKSTWLDRGLGWANNGSGDSNIVSNIADGIYKNSGWVYKDSPSSAIDLIEGNINQGNCVSLSSVWDNLSRALGISTVAGISTRAYGAGANNDGFLTTTPATTLDGNTGNAHPPAAPTNRWLFGMHQTGKHFLTYYDPTAGNGSQPNTYNSVDGYVQWSVIGLDANGDLAVDAPGTVKYLGTGNNGWGDYEYIVSGGSSSSIMNAGVAMEANENINELGEPVIISSSDIGIDTNGDGVWDQLEISVSLNIASAGEYTLSGVLLSGSNIITSRSNVDDTIIPTSITTPLSPGLTNITIRFSGEDIRRAEFDGNYEAEFQIYDQDGNRIDRKSFSTDSYDHNQFGEYPARFIGTPVVTTPDVNGDGLYDFLSVTSEVHVGIAGNYMIQGKLSGSGTPIANAHVSQPLSVGTSQLTVPFNGEMIHASGMDGPYTVELSLYNEETEIGSRVVNTKAYNHTEFADPPVEFQTFSDYGTDSDSNGLFNSLTLLAGMNVYTAGTYRVTAWLEGQNGESITYATWQDDYPIGLQEITLEFPGEAVYQSGIDGPYTVKFVRAVGGVGQLAASKQDAHETQPYGYKNFEAPVPPLVTATGNYTDAAIDIDGNGLFDSLTIGVEVLAADSGVVVVSGRLIDKMGEEIVWTSNFGSVTADVPQVISLDFDGRYIFGNLEDGPFDLKSLLVYHTGDPTQANWVQDAFTTEFYAYEAFEPGATITGFVKNEADSPISKALLSLGSTDFDFTNSQGVYHLVSLTGGAYSVSLSDDDGYPADSWEVFVNGNMVGSGNTIDVYVGVGDILQVDFRQPVNQPPNAVCVSQMVNADGKCQGDASIDAGSDDPDGDPITIEQSPPGPYGLGDTNVTLTVTDDKGASSSCSAVVTVIDTLVPEISVSVSPEVLWPPNHEMQDITATVVASDTCDVNPAIVLTSVVSDEPDNGKSDGNTVNDIQGADIGTDDRAFMLRAERSGKGNGRIYTITYDAMDASGNRATKSATVRVPHNR